MTNARINYARVAPEPYKSLLEIKKWLDASGVERRLLSLIDNRVSQINGCAFCLDMHTHEARELGVTQQQLDVLSAWREAPLLFTDAERAVFVWAEHLTRIADDGAPDDAYEALRSHFSDEQITALTWAIVAINTWNRLAIGFAVNPRSRAGK